MTAKATGCVVLGLLCLTLLSATAIAGIEQREHRAAVAYAAVQPSDYGEAGPRIAFSAEETEQPRRRDLRLAASLARLGEIHAAEGDYAEAEACYNQALVILETVLGPDHPEVAVLLVYLAALHLDLGDDAEAEQLSLRALAIWANAPTR